MKRRLLDQMIQQGGFTATQETSHYPDWDVGV